LGVRKTEDNLRACYCGRERVGIAHIGDERFVLEACDRAEHDEAAAGQQAEDSDAGILSGYGGVKCRANE